MSSAHTVVLCFIALRRFVWNYIRFPTGLLAWSDLFALFVS
jgi:hypothetical protein